MPKYGHYYLIVAIIIIYYRKYLEDESLDKKKETFDTSGFTLRDMASEAVSSNLVPGNFAFCLVYACV